MKKIPVAQMKLVSGNKHDELVNMKTLVVLGAGGQKG
jgi:hypothetical protein